MFSRFHEGVWVELFRSISELELHLFMLIFQIVFWEKGARVINQLETQFGFYDKKRS